MRVEAPEARPPARWAVAYLRRPLGAGLVALGAGLVALVAARAMGAAFEAAREVAVGALGTVYAVSGGEEATSLLGASLAHQWSLASALAFLAWYVFAPQCASTLSVVKRETNSWRWPIIMFAYMTALAYAAAFIVYRVAVSLGAG